MTRQLSCDQHVRWKAGCDLCNLRASRAYNRRILRQLQGAPTAYPGGPATRWVRELRAAGYRLDDIAEHSGVDFSHVFRISNVVQRWTQLRVYHALERTYLELRDFPGPSRRAASVAAAKGWTPPTPQTDPVEPATADLIAVERALRGEPVKLQHPDRVHAVLQLADAGYTTVQISNKLHMNRTYIDRILSGDVEERRRGRKKTA